ncbi:hypothetical protein E1265_12390 [Streptomyces sp. 8K308]|nr:hypothetical protein E1265_12390 [Streptomyces sp. 8K308]
MLLDQFHGALPAALLPDEGVDVRGELGVQGALHLRRQVAHGLQECLAHEGLFGAALFVHRQRGHHSPMIDPALFRNSARRPHGGARRRLPGRGVRGHATDTAALVTLMRPPSGTFVR